jgi:hypothetical protein
MARFPHLNYYFVKYRSQAEDIVVEDNVLWFNGTESFDAITEKTKRAFHWVITTRTNDYDFICRPNISSFLVLETYLRELRKYPLTACCVAIRGQYQDTFFPSGACYTLSMDVVRFIVDNPTLSSFHIDDVCIGHYLTQMGVHIQQPFRHMIEHFHSDPTEEDPAYIQSLLSSLPEEGYHIRIKNRNRAVDAILHARLVDALLARQTDMEN